MHPHRSHWITALAAVFAVALAEAPVFAQGVSPWLNAVDVLQQAFTGPGAARNVLVCHRAHGAWSWATPGLDRPSRPGCRWPW